MASKRLRLNQWLTRTWSRFKNPAKYVTWHTGLQPAASPSFQKLVTRPRKVLHWLRYQIRKKALFDYWHTGLQPAASPTFQRLVTRVRKVRKQASYKIRKLAKYQLFHTGLSPAPQSNAIQNVSLKTRRQKKLKRKRRLAIYQLFHTGQFTLSPIAIKLKTRPRRISEHYLKGVRFKKARMGPYWFTGLTPPPPPVGLSNWLGVSLMSNTRRGGD